MGRKGGQFSDGKLGSFQAEKTVYVFKHPDIVALLGVIFHSLLEELLLLGEGYD
jgi:hypothetical protein